VPLLAEPGVGLTRFGGHLVSGIVVPRRGCLHVWKETQKVHAGVSG
jgi:hypothetical protein